MKITNVRACLPACPSPTDWRGPMGQFFVAIDTDVGITGHGVGGAGLAAVPIVRTVLRDLLLGRNPEEIETLWNDMYAATLAFGRKGVAVMAISGVDLALWDLRGKAEKRSVVSLLGGAKRTSFPVYTTVWDELPAEPGPFAGFKIHLGKARNPADVSSHVNVVAHARSQLGPGVPLMVDAWMLWTVESTLAFAEAALPYGLDWIEEPLSPDDEEGYAVLAERCPTPIAGGEHEFTARAFRPIIDRKLHRVLQPDVCWCGGLTELIRIYEMAKAKGVRVCPHRGAEVWSLPAIAALASPSDVPVLAEEGRPWLTWVKGQPPIRNGLIDVPDRPGFGAEIDEGSIVPLVGA